MPDAMTERTAAYKKSTLTVTNSGMLSRNIRKMH